MQRYVFDKLLHDRYLPDPGLLCNTNVKPLFLVREAEPSLKSMLNRFGPKWGWDERACLNYYVERLGQLERYTEILPPDGALLLTFEHLVHETEQAFAELQQFLQLKRGFSQRYDVDKSVGRNGVGDSSRHIRQGRIVRDRASDPVQLSSSVVQAAQEAHACTLDRLGKKFADAGRVVTQHAA